MSRKDIAEAIGLTSASVTIICNELLEEGLILEIGEEEEEKRAGRRKILLAINDEYKYVLCVGMEGDETYLSITRLSGSIVAHKTIPTDAKIPPEEFCKRIADELKIMMWEQQLPREKVLAVGVSVPGKVDARQGVSVNSYSIWNESVPVRALLEAELSLPVIVENNVAAFAESEILFGNGRKDRYIFMLKWGPGVGSAFIIKEEVYRGATGSTTEIGHTIARKNGRVCKCGRKGCLETEISTHAIIRSILEAYGDTPESQNEMPVLKAWLDAGNTLSYKNTGEWGALQDEKLQQILYEKIELFALGMWNVVRLIDPDKIVVWGYLFEIPDAFDRFRDIYRANDPTAGEDFIVKSQLVAKTMHTEALSVVLEQRFFNEATI
jgi:predicted NBD/HSP70 family sugar kinase